MAAVWVTVAAFAAMLVAGIFIFPGIRQKKLARKIEKAFGKAPGPGWGLSNCEDFWAAWLKRRQPESYIDDLTWHDLNMDEVFQRVNACQSAVGDVYLYRLLRMPRGGGEEPADLEGDVWLYEEDGGLRRQVQLALANLGRYNGHSLDVPLWQPEELRLKRQWLWRLCAFLPLLALPLAFFSVPLAVVLAFVFLFLNLMLMLALKGRYESGFIVVRYLAAMLHCGKRLAKLLDDTDPDKAAALREALRPFGGMRRSMSVLQFNELFTEGIGIVCPLSFFLVPMLSYGKIAAQLPGMHRELDKLYALLGRVDAAVAVLSYRKSLPWWASPEYRGKVELAFEDLVHPLICETAVPNSGSFTSDVLITGSNASGKSTFLKALAVNVITAQCIGTCTARRFQMKPGRLATSMAVADSLVDGDSYFVAEIKSMKRLLVQAEEGEFSYFFIDEILKGTNTVERVAAGAAVVETLHRANCLCFAATHDMELTVILAHCCENVHFRERVQEDGVHFDFVLQNGPATSRNAIRLLETMQFPEQLINNANSLVRAFEETGQWVEDAPEEPPPLRRNA